MPDKIKQAHEAGRSLWRKFEATEEAASERSTPEIAAPSGPFSGPSGSAPSKRITPTGTMSNLVGRWANVMIDGKPKYTVFIYGKADDRFFMVQAICALLGRPNVIRLVTLEDMRDWLFYADGEMASEEMARFCVTGKLRYNLSVPNNKGQTPAQP